MTTTTKLDALRIFDEYGAFFALPRGRTKDRFEKDWTDKPHTLEEARAHAARGGNVGILAGWGRFGPIVAVDADENFLELCEQFPDLAQTIRVRRDNAPERGKLIYEMDGAAPPSKAYRRPGEQHPCFELLSIGRHALIPPSRFGAGAYVLEGAEYGIRRITEPELARLWRARTGEDLFAPQPVAQAEARRPARPSLDLLAQVKAYWDSARAVFDHWGRGQDVENAKGDQVRLKGNGGLIVGTGDKAWKWYCHADEMGGDQIDAWGYCRFGTNWRRKDKDQFTQVLREMAEAAGIETRPGTNGHGPAKQVDTTTGEILETSTGYSLTDLGNARRLVARHGQDLRYCHVWGKWLVWDGQRWKIDDTAEVMRRAKATVASIYAEASQEPEATIRKAIADHAKRSESKGKLQAMIDLAESEPGIPVLPDQLDADPWLLNCLNGTLDLRTGKLRPHRREDLITKRVPVRYDADAGAPTWLAFLDRIMAGNQNLIGFTQRAIGYALTGDTSEQVMFFLYGRGANGKSTLLNTISEALEDYAQQTPTDTLMARQANGIQNDVARLRGARFVSSVETEEGRRLAEVLVKQLTGGDTLTARFLYGEFFEFRPQFKLFLATNHKPVIRGTDNAIWRRIRLVPFAVTIPEAEWDKKLPKKLRAELPGILAWAVRGCLEWQDKGLGTPDEVRQATESYRAEMDVLAAFLADCCVVAPTAQVTSKELYERYKTWCDENGERARSQKALGGHLVERGFQADRIGHNRTRGWNGLGLLRTDRPARTDADAYSDKVSTDSKVVPEKSQNVSASVHPSAEGEDDDFPNEVFF